MYVRWQLEVISCIIVVISNHDNLFETLTWWFFFSDRCSSSFWHFEINREFHDVSIITQYYQSFIEPNANMIEHHQPHVELSGSASWIIDISQDRKGRQLRATGGRSQVERFFTHGEGSQSSRRRTSKGLSLLELFVWATVIEWYYVWAMVIEWHFISDNDSHYWLIVVHSL